VGLLILLMPSVDHVDPDLKTLAFEIVSWLVNDCKSGLCPDRFIDLCARIAARKKPHFGLRK